MHTHAFMKEKGLTRALTTTIEILVLEAPCAKLALEARHRTTKDVSNHADGTHDCRNKINLVKRHPA